MVGVLEDLEKQGWDGLERYGEEKYWMNLIKDFGDGGT